MTEQKPLKYDLRGVSASKSEVHAAIEHLDKGLFPNAFCTILPDFAGNDPAFCNIMHADTAGTKTSLAYIYWKETGDLSVWGGIVQDAIVMNLDDMACAGCIDNIILSSTIGRNKHLVSGEVITEIIQSTSALLAKLQGLGIQITLAGGETADVGDIVRTIDVGYTAFARLKKSDVVDINIQPGDMIVGLASYGQSTYEEYYNGGMGSNGLTSARHDVLSNIYATKYPESFDPNTPKEVVYTGTRTLTEHILIENQSIPLGKLILSPTRTFLPFLKPALEGLKDNIHGIIHNTGGGQSKVLKFLKGNKAVKNNLLPVPPLFELIHEESHAPWREMFQVFNMGTRLEIYTDQKTAEELINLAASFHIDAQIIGHVEKSDTNCVEVLGPDGVITYL